MVALSSKNALDSLIFNLNIIINIQFLPTSLKKGKFYYSIVRTL